MMNIWRWICGGFDIAIYWFVETLFQIIMDLSNVEIFSQSVINDFARRIYIILGLIMVFKIMISFIQILINPEKMNDKEQGVSNILIRVVKALLMIVLVPMIFKTARLAQNYVIPVIPKVILGVTINPSTDGEASETMVSVGRMMAFYSFLPFFNYDNTSCDDGSIYGTGTQLGTSTTVPEIYSVTSAIVHVNDKDCNTTTSKDGYKYNYRWLISTFVGAYLVYVLVSIAVSIAIRTLKFAVCEFAAPIPIASYVDPKTSKQTFDTWVSTTWKIYLDLFIRLIIVYFIVFVFDTIFQQENLSIIYAKLNNDWWRCSLVTLFLIVGLLQFAKSAPKFIGDMLGLKGSGDFMGMFKGEGFKAFKEARGIPGTAAAAVSSGIKNFKNSYANSMAKNDPDAKWWKKAASGANALRRGVGGFAGATKRGVMSTYKGEYASGRFRDLYKKTVDDTISVSNAKVLEAKAKRDKNSAIRNRISASEKDISEAETNIGNWETESQRLLSQTYSGNFERDIQNADTLVNQKNSQRNSIQARLDRAKNAIKQYHDEYETADKNYRTLSSYNIAKKNLSGAEMGYRNAKIDLDNAMKNGVSGAQLETIRNRFLSADVALKNARNKLSEIENNNKGFDFTQDLAKVSSERNKAMSNYNSWKAAVNLDGLQTEFTRIDTEYNNAVGEKNRLSQLKIEYDKKQEKISAAQKNISEATEYIDNQKKEIVRPVITDIKTGFAEFMGDSIPRGKDYIDFASHIKGQKSSLFQSEAFGKIETDELPLVMKNLTNIENGPKGVFTVKAKDGTKINVSFEELIKFKKEVVANPKATLEIKDSFGNLIETISSGNIDGWYKNAQKAVGKEYVNEVIRNRDKSGGIQNSTILEAWKREQQYINSLNLPIDMKQKLLEEIRDDFGGYLAGATDRADALQTLGEEMLSYERTKQDS